MLIRYINLHECINVYKYTGGNLGEDIYIRGTRIRNNKDNIDSIFDKINRKISNSNLILSHLIVDEYELYDVFMIILDNIKHIRRN